MTNDRLVQAYRSLLHLSDLMAQEKDMEHLQQMVLRYAIELSGAERGVILLEEKDRLKVGATLNADEKNILSQISLSIAEEVLKEGVTLQTKDALDDDRFSKSESILLHHLRSILCIPIKTMGKTVGVLYLDHTRKATLFDEFTLDILEAYCQQVGIFLENAKLIAQYRQNEQDLKVELDSSEKNRMEVLRQLQEKTPDGNFATIRTQSPKILAILETVKTIAQTRLAVFIHGESGSGKEVLARGIHRHSLAPNGPFIAANCGAIPESLVESELFGYRKGAFTGAVADKKGLFEAAHGGTLFLDEIGELSASAQVKLLRVLQEREVVPVGDTKPRKVDVRIISASHRDLPTLIRESKFREDLFYRLCEYRVDLPPLRERAEDIPQLVWQFIQDYRKEHHIKEKLTAASDLLKCFMEYHWQGNIRELKNAVRVGCALRRGEEVNLLHYPQNSAFLETKIPSPEKISKEKVERMSLLEVEKEIYHLAYKAHGFQPKKTYEALSVSNATFFKKLKAWDLKNRPPHSKQRQIAYNPHLSLQAHLDKYMEEIHLSCHEKPYCTIKLLQISPGYFYQWKKRYYDNKK